jgi:hypothetical protein
MEKTTFEGRANPNAYMLIRCGECHGETVTETRDGETIFACPTHGWMATAKNTTGLCTVCARPRSECP